MLIHRKKSLLACAMLWLLSGCCKKQTCPQTEPLVVKLKPSCDVTFPELPIAADEIGETLTDEQADRVAVSLIILINYLNELKVRCGRN